MGDKVDGEGFGLSTLELDAEASGGPWNLSLARDAQAAKWTLAEGQTAVLGSRPGVNLVVRDAAVSGRHLRVHATPRGLELEDLGSKNGTYVGGARVPRAVLRSGGSFVVGRSEVLARRGNSSQRESVSRCLPGMVGSSEPMRRLAREVARVARLDAPILIVGESGTGKDVLARAIHALSGRAGRYVALNAGALPEALADSELFGHRRGAFTGAVQTHEGAFEQAHRGTLFLDEVGDLNPSVQVKLLRAVEDGEIRKVGATAPVRVQARIVAATWAALPQRIEEGRFRADLYHRISTFVIEVPPLRRRRGDIPLLAADLLQSLSAELGNKHLSSGAVDRLSEYSFPGNVRELFSVVYRAAVLAAHDQIDAAEVEVALGTAVGAHRGGGVDARRLLAAHGGNVSAAARSAQVARSTFRSWLKRQTDPVRGSSRSGS